MPLSLYYTFRNGNLPCPYLWRESLGDRPLSYLFPNYEEVDVIYLFVKLQRQNYFPYMDELNISMRVSLL